MRGYDYLDESARLFKETIRKYFQRIFHDLKTMYGSAFLNTRTGKNKLSEIEYTTVNLGFLGVLGLSIARNFIQRIAHQHLRGNITTRGMEKFLRHGVTSSYTVEICTRDASELIISKNLHHTLLCLQT